MASVDSQMLDAREVSDCDRQLLAEQQDASYVSQEAVSQEGVAISQQSACSEVHGSPGIVQINLGTKRSKIFVDGELRDAAMEFSNVLPTDSWLADRVVVMVIGPEQRKWAVHEKLLTSKSPYIERILRENETGGHGKEVVLADTDPKLFSMMLRWVYGTAFATSGGSRVFRYPKPDNNLYTVRDFLGLYILGGQVGIVGVKNAAIDAVYAYFNGDDDEDGEPELRPPNPVDMQMIFDNTPTDSHMRRLLTAHALFYLFDRRREGPLPPEWEQVLRNGGEIGWAMISMLSEWKWVMGGNVPPMRIKNRQAFHETIVIDLDPPVKEEEVEQPLSF